MKTKINTVKINKTDKPVTRLLKGKKREKIKITNIRSKEVILLQTPQTLKENTRKIYMHTFKNIDKIGQFL